VYYRTPQHARQAKDTRRRSRVRQCREEQAAIDACVLTHKMKEHIMNMPERNRAS